MAKLSRKGDANAVGGKIVRGASTVFANGIQVGLHVSDITKHPGGGKHNAAKTTEGSPTVFAEGVAVLRVGSGNDCGHSITEGSPDVFVP
jgi:uncharacterized Zn-binding protein involved in type VI secretion